MLFAAVLSSLEWGEKNDYISQREPPEQMLSCSRDLFLKCVCTQSCLKS